MQDLPAETTRDLFTPVEVGPLTLPNRIVMAPLTRSRAGPGNVPTFFSLCNCSRWAPALIQARRKTILASTVGHCRTGS